MVMVVVVILSYFFFCLLFCLIVVQVGCVDGFQLGVQCFVVVFQEFDECLSGVFGLGIFGVDDDNCFIVVLFVQLFQYVVDFGLQVVGCLVVIDLVSLGYLYVCVVVDVVQWIVLQ